ncbi:MAG TPA: sugar phosphate isomerase/epimerase family protein [Phycisphaerae bacterium]|nr:sugar phosphate isomerase/epimerase family protein [Phycisphaerae bacterium]HOM51844.1 sugar phosphate isomerase/epimerase family protein [Phycisphaerae bacterium]HOQ88216.1 sugar phosphate isomerase/epimerase family protein [Phycisphaerae bacterium]HPP28625.1 sugar phosphate isomerase/epimerase family protein [Phycisphaerae bacterium]HPU27303.1 sugar phosphate isomerase/epimerase family protein [Phycisphaerae bacterium]
MKIGFSSSACPDWDLRTMLEQARALGYEAIELCAPRDRQQSAVWAGLAETSNARQAIEQAGIELTCLATDCSLHGPDGRTLEEQKTRVRQSLDLAGQLGCPYVSIKAGTVPRFHRPDVVLLRIVTALRELAHHAAERRTTLLVENDGSFAGSRDLWFILDAVAHPSVRGCWNPCQAQAAGDMPGRAVPRIGRHICVTHMLDAILEPGQGVKQYTPVGQGNVDLSRYLVLMHGIHSNTRLIVSWPMPGSPPEPRELLPASLEWMRKELAKIAESPDLSAYKGDKNAPRFALR